MSDLHIPLEICREILLRSPAESLFRFRTICKGWRTVIDDPSFGRAHTNDRLSSSSSSHTLVIRNTTNLGPLSDAHLYTFDLDAVNLSPHDQEIYGSSLDLTYIDSSSSLLGSACNGLILVAPKTLETPLEIWNPSTHERLQLPQIDFIDHSGPVLTGLGYDHLAQDFKAVAMHRKQTHVYSLRSDTWRTIGVCLFGSRNSWGPEYLAVFLCGALHWLFYNEIVALDIGTEKHRYIQLNNALPKTVINFKKRIDVLGGCLVVSWFSFSHYEVWVMNDYGSDDESWTKLFSISKVGLTPFCERFRPVAYMKDKNQMVFQDGLVSGFILFDIESESKKRVRINDFTGYYLEAHIIPQSIFRLRDHCSGGSGTSRIMPLGPPRKMKVPLTIVKKHY